MPEPISVSRDIAASPDRVWALVSDLPRMGEWSNENVGGRWVDGATGPAPGAKFRGRNRNGFRRWATSVTVVDAEPGTRFAFSVSLAVLKISEWAYDIEATDSGCRVTETWTNLSPRWWKPIARLATGVTDRAAHTRAGMEQTLERVAIAAEASDG